MRLLSLAIAGFRGFPRSVEFDLNADAVIIAGANGSGKTSFFDAILWALCGTVSRLDGSSASLVSRYSISGEARVELAVSADDGTRTRIVRRFDGSMHLSVQVNDADPVVGHSAEALLIDLLWPDAKAAADQLLALTRSLTRATCLQQDAVRDFVEADTEQDRFQIVGELVGAGRIGELQRQLESGRNLWTRATTGLTKDIATLETRRRLLVDRLARLGPGEEGAATSADFQVWASSAAELLGATGLMEVPLEFSAEGLDRTLRELTSLEHSDLRGAARAQALLNHLESQPAEGPSVEPLRFALAQAQQARAVASAAVAEAQSRAAARRRRQVEATERVESLRALAELALQHLDERCPVCEQTYDRDATRARLETLLQEAADLGDSTAETPDVSKVAALLADADRGVIERQAELRDAQEAAQRRMEWTQVLATVAKDLGYAESTPSPQAVRAQLSEFQRRLDVVRTLKTGGEQLSLRLAREAEAAQREELIDQLAQAETVLASQQAEVASRNETGEAASQIIDAIRVAGNDVVAKELERLEPLLQRIFATVDPHPSFRVVGFLTRVVRGKGRLWTTLDDAAGDVNVQEPGLVLSSSQLNVLAVAIFLTLNLAIPTLPLQVVALDDPLQSLDNINLLGLADLLRRVRQDRQVLVSTHDVRLANLLERKLRPVLSTERTVRIDLAGWTPNGPSIEQREVPQDLSHLRLVASA